MNTLSKVGCRGFGWGLLALAGAAGCSSGDRAADSGSAAAAPITRQELLGAEYPTDLVDAGVVRLESGMFRAVVEEGRGEEVGAQLVEPVALGTLADGRPGAAVVLIMSGGGSGTFSWLYLMTREDGALRTLADAYLGDRIELTGLRLHGDTVTVTLVTQGPDDPMCCPTLVVERAYVYDGMGVLSEKGAARREK